MEEIEELKSLIIEEYEDDKGGIDDPASTWLVELEHIKNQFTYLETAYNGLKALVDRAEEFMNHGVGCDAFEIPCRCGLQSLLSDIKALKEDK